MALPIDMPDAAQAVHSVVSGPRVPSAIDTSAAPMLAISAVTQNGLSRSGPASNSLAWAISCVFSPPMPVPIEQPIRAASARDIQVGVRNRLGRGRDGQLGEAVGLAHRALVHVLGRVEPLHLPGDVHRALGHLEALDARHARPARPGCSPRCRRMFSPHGVTAPIPEITTRRLPLALISPTLRPPPARLRSRRPPHPTRGTAPPGRRRPDRRAGRAASAPGSPRGRARAERR